MLDDHFIKIPKFYYNKLNINQVDSLELIDENELTKIILDLNNEKSQGLDNISNRIIKIFYKNDKDYLINVYNLTLRFSKIT